MPLPSALHGLLFVVLCIVLGWAFLKLEGWAQLIAGLALELIAITIMLSTLFLGWQP